MTAQWKSVRVESREAEREDDMEELMEFIASIILYFIIIFLIIFVVQVFIGIIAMVLAICSLIQAVKTKNQSALIIAVLTILSVIGAAIVSFVLMAFPDASAELGSRSLMSLFGVLELSALILSGFDIYYLYKKPEA